jgi:hypothetical protein
MHLKNIGPAKYFHSSIIAECSQKYCMYTIIIKPFSVAKGRHKTQYLKGQMLSNQNILCHHERGQRMAIATKTTFFCCRKTPRHTSPHSSANTAISATSAPPSLLVYLLSKYVGRAFIPLAMGGGGGCRASVYDSITDWFLNLFLVLNEVHNIQQLPEVKTGRRGRRKPMKSFLTQSSGISCVSTFSLSCSSWCWPFN